MKTWAVINPEGLVIDTLLWDGDDSVFDVNLSYPGQTITVVEYTENNIAGIGYHYDGEKFIAPPPPPVDKQQLIFAAEGQRLMTINDTNSVFLDWQTKLLLKIATKEQKNSVQEWLSYLENVRNVDVSNAPDVDWPERPDVPEISQL